MFYIYILKDRITSKLYKGFTDDLRQRLKDHKSRKVKTTKYWDIELIYYEGFKDEKSARIEEKFLKSGKGRERLKYLFKN